jgi:predicted enzyme related to lactoylglutathione lyase
MTTNTTIPTGRFVWFEHISKEETKAQAFYAELFGWKTQAMPMSGGTGTYTMIVADGQTIGGYMATPPGAPPHSHWISHLQVASAAETAAKVKAAGGKVALEPTKMGDFGTYAVALDPSGAALALWQPGKPEGDGNFKGKPNTWCWNELMTDSVDKCLAFYKAIGGFAVKTMPMPTGDYSLLSFDGQDRAGVMKTPMAGVPNHWLPYVQVTSADQTAAKAKKLGAQIHVEPTDIPNVGRFAVFSDVTGASIGILQPAR